MRTYHCEQCRTDTRLAGDSVGGGFCPSCGAAVTPVQRGEEQPRFSATAINYDEVAKSFTTSHQLGALMAAQCREGCPTPLDAAICVGAVYVFFCSMANVHPGQFAGMLTEALAFGDPKPDPTWAPPEKADA